DGRLGDVDPELEGGPLEIGWLGHAMLQRREHEHSQQCDGAELAFPLDHPRAGRQIFEVGATELLQSLGVRAHDLHGKAPSSTASLDTTRVGIGAFPSISSPITLTFVYGASKTRPTLRRVRNPSVNSSD